MKKFTNMNRHSYITLSVYYCVENWEMDPLLVLFSLSYHTAN